MRSTGIDIERISAVLGELHARYVCCDEGAVASYIPELARAAPDAFGIALATVEGEVCSVGDCDAAFTIQSVSKPFTYGLALEDRGREAVMRSVGVEPSGDSFDSIIKLDTANRPHNPMVNAGAIATTSLIAGGDPTEKLNRVLDMMGRYIGHRPNIDVAVFMSERTTGHRNRAMAHLMQHFGVLGSPVEEALDLYFQQCSVLVTARDLALMAATLANGGVHPVTGECAVERGYLRDILTVMHTCGMYNYAGEWAYTVGLPAKSGVSGALIAVVPGQFGIAVYSPPVDERGTSVRGIKVCEDLSRSTGMHVFDTWLSGGGVLDRFERAAAPTPELPATTVAPDPSGDGGASVRPHGPR